MNKSPTVSIVMNVFNGMPYLPETLLSILNQTFRDFEVVVVDDGSTDGTLAWLKRQADPRLRVYAQGRRTGVACSKTRAIRLARGRWVTFFDADDLMRADSLDIRVRYLRAHPDAGAVFTPIKQLIGPSGRALPALPLLSDAFNLYAFLRRSRRYTLDLLRQTPPPPCALQSLMIRSSFLRRAGRLDHSLLIHNDWDYLLRLARLTDFHFLDHPSLRYRLHGSNLSFPLHRAGMQTQVRECNILSQRHGPSRPVSLQDFQRGRARLSKQYSALKSGATPHALLTLPATAPVRTVLLAYEGPFSGDNAFAVVNRSLALALHRRHGISLALRPCRPLDQGPRQQRLESEDYPLLRRLLKTPGEPDVVLHFDASRAARRHPQTRKPLIQIIAWETGALPQAWVRTIHDKVSQCWAISSEVRRMCLDSGVPPDKVCVIPHGVDPRFFNPEGPRLPGLPKDVFVFLYVGALIARKGLDLLLDAYAQAFSSKDPVLLYIKAGAQSGWGYNNPFVRRIHSLGKNRLGPRVKLDQRFLSTRDLARLYRAADCLVAPYRAEGFGLPILEAMACGLPTIVPELGCCRDFADAKTSYLLRSRNILLPMNTANGIPLAGPAGWIEPDRDSLIELLRHAFTHARENACLGQHASRRVLEHFTWDHAARRAAVQLRRWA